VNALNDIRAVFEKKDSAVYISHLDLNRCMQRAFRRSKLPVWYTEGFNPHVYVMFALALSLGFESSCEIMDFTLTEDIPYEQIKNSLNSVLPDGIRIISVSAPKLKHTEIAFADFKIKIFNDNPVNLREKFIEFVSQEKIIVLKRNKKKQMIETDIKPVINVLDSSAKDEYLEIMLRLPAGTQKNYNPTLLTDVFCKYADIPSNAVRIERERIICSDGKDFS